MPTRAVTRRVFLKGVLQFVALSLLLLGAAHVIGAQPIVAREGPTTLTLRPGVPCTSAEALRHVRPEYHTHFSAGTLVNGTESIALCWDEEQTRVSPSDAFYILVIPQVRQPVPMPKARFGVSL